MSRTRKRKRTRTKNKNIKINKLLLPILASILILMFFSIIFSLINIGNNKISKGVLIGKVDVSNLLQEEATNKMEKWYREVVLKDIKVKYKDFQETILVEQLPIKLDIDKAVKKACLVGKSGNIVKDNYEILSAFLFTKKIENNIQIEQEAIDKKIEELNTKLPNAMIESNYYIEEENLIIKTGKKGIKIEEEKLKKELEDVIQDSQKKEIEIPTKEVSPKPIDIRQIHEEIYKEKQDAIIEQNPVVVKPEVNGVDFALSIEEIESMLKEEKEEYIIPLKITKPDVTLEKLGNQAFPEKLGEYSTTYNTSNENRENNLKLASEKIDGTIVLPGEIFSYNKVVGERTIAKGYKEAAVYSGGKVVNGIGGGICQISSTLYNAVIFANLEITQRSNHQFLTSYVTAGRDATVSWGTIDFCFKNTRKYPIKIKSEVKNGVVTLGIYGIKEEKEYEILIESQIIETLPLTVNYVKDSNLEQGEEKVKQYGADGVKSVTYKIIKENGVITSRTVLSTDIYSPLEKIIIKGTKKVQDVNAIPLDEKEQLKELNPELLEAIKELD